MTWAMGRIAGSTPEKMIYAAFLLVSCAIIGLSLYYGVGSFRKPGPGLFPLLIGLTMTPLSLILLLQTSRQAVSFFQGEGLKTFIEMIATFVFWIIAMPLLGYPIVTLIATFAVSKIMKLEGWVRPAGLAIGTAVFIYLLFDYWLYIDLPRGILG